MLSTDQLKENRTIKDSGLMIRRVSVKMNDSEKKMLDDYSDKTGISVSELIRRSIYKTLK